MVNIIKTGHPKWSWKLNEQYSYRDDRFGGLNVNHEYFTICGNVMSIRAGYSYDGVTGFPDKKEWLRGALIHDVMLQAIYDEGLVPMRYLNTSHRIMRDIVKEDDNTFWGQLIFGGLMAFHKVWNKVTT